MKRNTQEKIYGNVHLKTVTKSIHANIPEILMCILIQQKIGPVHLFWMMVLHMAKNVCPRTI